MDVIVEQVEALAAAADEQTHRKLVDTVRKLLYSIESPEDTNRRLIHGQFQLSVARVAQESKIIDVLVRDSRNPVTVAQVAKETGVSLLLTERLLRYMGSVGMATQVSDDSYVASKGTETLNMPGVRGGVGFGVNIVLPSAQALPAFLQENGYKSPENIKNCAWYPGHNKEQDVMQYIRSRPSMFAEFNTYMQYQRFNSKIWMDVYPIDLSPPSKDIFFVDIGGGMGHMCVALKERFPTVSGRIVLQDIPQVVGTLTGDQPFEPMVHDYRKEQPIKEARYYYLRNIMHNLTDELCRIVLTHTKAAMGPYSKILVDDIVMPGKDAHWYAVGLDMLMMSLLGAIERTETQWNALFESVGLKILNKYIYDSVKGDTVMEVVAA